MSEDNKTVLVVEDDREINALVGAYAEICGLHPRSAFDGMGERLRVRLEPRLPQALDLLRQILEPLTDRLVQIPEHMRHRDQRRARIEYGSVAREAIHLAAEVRIGLAYCDVPATALQP